MITYKVTVDGKGNIRWFNEDGDLHRVDGPAVELADGRKEWWLNGNCHRVNGPAVESADGSKLWYLNGVIHREDGPAVEYANGSKLWYLNGECHHVNGPAVESADGTKQWWLNGNYYSESDFNAEMLKRKSPCAGTVVEVEGVKYTLTPIA